MKALWVLGIATLFWLPLFALIQVFPIENWGHRILYWCACGFSGYLAGRVAARFETRGKSE